MVTTMAMMLLLRGNRDHDGNNQFIYNIAVKQLILTTYDIAFKVCILIATNGRTKKF